MKILAIVGSPRREGNSSYLVDIALEEAKKQGIEVEKVTLIEKQIGWCLGHVECGSLPPEKIHKVGGKAQKPGDVKANQELIHKARELGHRMAEELKHA